MALLNQWESLVGHKATAILRGHAGHIPASPMVIEAFDREAAALELTRNHFMLFFCWQRAAARAERIGAMPHVA
jgi:hypothetical protein